MNPHCWRKFKQAQANLQRFKYGKRRLKRKHGRRLHYWAGQFLKWLNLVVERQ